MKFTGIVLLAAAALPAAQLDNLVREALANNPEIVAAQRRYEAARQRPTQESSLPDPTMQLGYASVGGPFPGQGLGTYPNSNIGVMVSQELPSAAKRKLRGEIARREADAEYQQYLSARLSVQSRVTQAFHRLHHAYAAIEIVNRGKELAANVIKISEARYAAGKASQPDILKAQLQLSLLETRIVQLEQDRAAAEAALNALLNRRAATPVDRPDESEPGPLAVDVDELLVRARGAAPELRRDEALIERNNLAVNLASRDFRSDPKVSAGYYNMGTMPAMFQFQVELPLHIRPSHLQSPALGERIYRLSEARQNFEAAGQNLQFRVREAYAAAQTAWRLMQLYSDTIMPQCALTIESSLAAYQSGTSDLLPVLANVMAKVDAEERYHEQKMTYALSLARLEEMTGISPEGKQ